ncbi:MAG: carboxypeptidase-like regulatory domain-containing protein, partial [Chitinophagaceae bacterium]
MRKFLSILGILILLAFSSHAQNRDVSGKVVDNNGQPVPNASIQEKGTRKGTLTDANGSFKINVSQGATLLVSSVGFDNQNVPVSASGDVQIQLTVSSQSLSEVVVTGVGVATSKKKL